MSSLSKPTAHEDQYIVEVERKRMRASHEAMETARCEEKTKQLRDLHWMHCPNCGLHLHKSTCHGVQVARCGDCKGIFIQEDKMNMIAGEEAKGLVDGLLSIFKP